MLFGDRFENRNDSELHRNDGSSKRIGMFFSIGTDSPSRYTKVLKDTDGSA
jgi:hypothetical protein